MFSKTLLPNGLRVVTVPMPAVKSVSALVMVEAGSRYETKKINGLSHFLEHMTFKGTKKRPNKLAITSLIDGIGGNFNAFTGKEYTGFYIKAESRHTELILDILSDILTNSLFDPAEIDKERGVIIEEINMSEDQPLERVGELFEKLLYDDQPLSWRISGEKENIQNITHQELVDYSQNMYHSGAIVVGLAGDIPCHPECHAELVSASLANARNRSNKLRDPDIRQDDRQHDTTYDLIEKCFGSVPKGGENQYERVVEKQNKPQSLIYNKKTDQVHLSLGVRAYDLNHPDRYVLAVLGAILGGNVSSRLFTEMRDKRGLAYYINSDSAEFHDVGYFVTQAGIGVSNVEEAIKVILEQYNLMIQKPVFDDELRRAKDSARGKMALALEDTFRVASFYTGQELMKRSIEIPDEVLNKIEKVSKEDIQRVAKDIFVDQKLNLAMIGPFEDKNKFDKLLKLQ